MRVADYTINFIYDKGASHIFTLAGGGAMFLNDAVACHKKIKFICHHHEQAAAMAGEAFAKMTNKIGAVMVTSGPGSTNAITGLMEAYQNSIPVIFISSQAKKSQMCCFSGIPSLRQFGVQEVDIIPIVKRLTKYAVVVKNPEDIRYHLEKAYFLAKSGRPGPVWIDIPPDVAGSVIEPKKLKPFTDKQSIKNDFSDISINQLIEMLRSARKPLIIAGGGIRLSGAVNEFKKLVKQFKIPVVVTSMAIDLLEHENPCYIGHGGINGQRSANIVTQQADLLLVIGSRLAVPFTGYDYDKFAPFAKKIVVDIDPEEHKKKTVKINLFIQSDAKFFINKLFKTIKGVKFNFRKDWLVKCIQIKERFPSCLPEYKKTKDGVNIYCAIDKISQCSSDNDIFITDAGATAYMSTQTIKIKRGQRMIFPGCSLTMGYNLPAIIGIWAARPKSGIICITGDGSFQMNIHELQTIIHYKIPAKIFITNNQGYLAIRTTQRNFFDKRFIGEGSDSGVSFPDAKKIVKAYGFKFFRVRNIEELNRIIPKVLSYKGPVICDIICPYWQEMVKASSKKLPNGKIVSLPIDNMYPFLPEEEMKKIREDLS